mmetsp:Transcript_2286/g.3249  ORF Transcript_2286/g.3249 Transcript_2286/m.3249 type:complete len:141 (-) Transcript_2286:324-746(-)
MGNKLGKKRKGRKGEGKRSEGNLAEETGEIIKPRTQKKPTETAATSTEPVKRKARKTKPAEPDVNDPNPGKTPLERLLWHIKLLEYYPALQKAGFDKGNLSKLEELAKDEGAFKEMCKKAGLKIGHIRKFSHALLDSSYP